MFTFHYQDCMLCQHNIPSFTSLSNVCRSQKPLSRMHSLKRYICRIAQGQSRTKRKCASKLLFSDPYPFWLFSRTVLWKDKLFWVVFFLRPCSIVSGCVPKIACIALKTVIRVLFSVPGDDNIVTNCLAS